MIYLLHSTVAVGGNGRNGAQHYLGWCREGHLLERLEAHRAGRSRVALVSAFRKAGAELWVGRVWQRGTRIDERRLKRAGHFRGHCVYCNPTIDQAWVP